MANIAQMVNVLQAMILTDGPRMLLTPTYHVFSMYRPFQGATALPATVAGPEYRLGEVAFPALSASAALTPGGELVVAVVNADARDAHAVSFDVGNRSLAGAQVLRGASLDAHNSFDRPDAVKPADAAVPVRGSVARYEMPARSVLVARFKERPSLAARAAARSMVLFRPSGGWAASCGGGTGDDGAAVTPARCNRLPGHRPGPAVAPARRGASGRARGGQPDRGR
jgi:hypothetical protein